MLCIAVDQSEKHWSHMFGFFGVLYRGNYSIAGYKPMNTHEMYKLAQEAGVESVQSMIPSEKTMFECTFIGFCAYLLWQMV